LEATVRIRFSFVSAVVVALAFIIARPAFAQDTMRGDFAVGYSVMRDSDASETFPAGFVLAITGDVNTKIRIVGEFGGNYKTITFPGGRLRLGVVTYQGGLRFVPVSDAKVRPFVQVLAGGARFSGTVLGVIGATDGTNGVAIQPGGGVDIRLHRLVDGRFQADYRAMHANGETLGEFRIAFSAAIPFGRK
jgi:hypothetical protein